MSRWLGKYAVAATLACLSSGAVHVALMLIAPALAQGYPVKPLRLIVPYPADSSSNNIIARLLAERLSPALGQRVLVENRPGAGGNVASEYVAKADDVRL